MERILPYIKYGLTGIYHMINLLERDSKIWAFFILINLLIIQEINYYLGNRLFYQEISQQKVALKIATSFT